MRKCRNCNVEMMEDNRISMTAHLTRDVKGDSAGRGTNITIAEKPSNFFQKYLHFSPDLKFECKTETAICPRCGLVENYVQQENLDKIKELLKISK